jgi:hypothetical protein
MLPLDQLVEVALAKYLSKAGEIARNEHSKDDTDAPIPANSNNDKDA